MTKLFITAALGVVAGVIVVQLIAKKKPNYIRDLAVRIKGKVSSTKRAFLRGYTTSLNLQEDGHAESVERFETA